MSTETYRDSVLFTKLFNNDTIHYVIAACTNISHKNGSTACELTAGSDNDECKVSITCMSM